MKKIAKIILIILLVLIAYIFFFQKEKRCILDIQSLSTEGYELVQVSQYEYKISFLGELGKLEQNITLNKNSNIISVNEIRTEYNKPFYFDDFEIKSQVSNLYLQEDLDQIENIKILKDIFESNEGCLEKPE